MCARAAAVEACDIDPFACAAVALNAAVNGVTVRARLEDLVGTDEGWDVVTAGDVSYERDMAARVTDWLAALAARGALVLIGDPGRSYLQKDRLEAIACYDIAVVRDIEDAPRKQTRVWRFRG